MRRRPSALIAVAGVSLLAGCSGSSPATTAASSSTATSTASSVSGPITVFAAASLTESFGTIGTKFELAHPGTKVTFSFGASNTLATQIVNGAPADVFASAAPKNMQQVVDAKAAGHATTFARNTLEVAVPAANPAHITQLSDLAKPGVKVAVCAPGVPAGAGALQVFTKAKLDVTPVSQEADVKAALTKAELGEVDAAVVWSTDAQAGGATVKGVAIPADLNITSSYPIATLTNSKNPATAAAFVAYVLSADGQAVLAKAGFAAP